VSLKNIAAKLSVCFENSVEDLDWVCDALDVVGTSLLLSPQEKLI
jgi:hypothetical protein